MRLLPRRGLPLRLLAATALALPLLAVVDGPAAAGTTRRIHDARFDTAAELASGRASGLQVVRGGLALGGGTRLRTVAGQRYEQGSWTSPWRSPGFSFTELIPSWHARTPGNSWVEVQVRGRRADGTRSSWDTLARWTSGDRHLLRTSFASQDDDLARVAVDTWQAPNGLASWQLRLRVGRRAGSSANPRVESVRAVVTRLPSVTDVATSTVGKAAGVRLTLPRYSQMAHSGHYSRWGGGGQAWCSPTAVSMVLGYHRRLPPASAYSWVPDGHVHPWVDHGARMTYDERYGGTGNWSFNTAYAAGRTGTAFVTRLRSLRAAERYILAGIPLVVSISFGRGELDGAPISATNGHLLVVSGFTKSGDVVVDDPAAHTHDGVRRVYDRAQFEDAWLPRSGGLTYVIAGPDHPLP